MSVRRYVSMDGTEYLVVDAFTERTIPSPSSYNPDRVAHLGVSASVSRILSPLPDVLALSFGNDGSAVFVDLETLREFAQGLLEIADMVDAE